MWVIWRSKDIITIVESQMEEQIKNALETWVVYSAIAWVIP